MLIHDAFDCGDTEWLSNYERHLGLVAGGGDDGGSGLGVVGFVGYGESVRLRISPEIAEYIYDMRKFHEESAKSERRVV